METVVQILMLVIAITFTMSVAGMFVGYTIANNLHRRRERELKRLMMKKNRLLTRVGKTIEIDKMNEEYRRKMILRRKKVNLFSVPKDVKLDMKSVVEIINNTIWNFMSSLILKIKERIKNTVVKFILIIKRSVSDDV